MGDRPFWVSGLLGIGAILMTLALTALGPRPGAPLPQGFLTPIIAFEFAGSAGEIEQLFTHSDAAAGAEMMQSMDRVNRLDFLYMLLYNGFLFTFALTCARLSGNRLYYVPAVLALGVLAADALENAQLLGITQALRQGEADLNLYLARLHWFTWLKWGGIALIFLMLIPFFYRGDVFARFLAMFAAMPFVLALLAYFNRGILNELFALAIGATFLLMTIFCWRYRAPRSGVD